MSMCPFKVICIAFFAQSVSSTDIVGYKSFRMGHTAIGMMTPRMS
jgi:hypothetical protein